MSTVSKNIFWSSIAAGLQIYTGGVIFIIMAKMMSIHNFGLLSFGFSFGTLLATCLDFGHSLMIMKDYLRKQFKPDSYVLNSMAQKAILVLFFGVVFFLVLNTFYELEWVAIGNKFLIFAVLSSYVIYLQAILRVKNKFKLSALSITLYAILISIVVLLYYFDKLTILNFVTCMIYAKLIQLILSIVLCRDIFHKNWYNHTIQKYLVKNSWSYGAHFIFGTFYFTIDTQIIALLLEPKDVALYQSIFRIIYIFLIVSDVATTVLLPYLASKYTKEEKIDELSTNILYLLLIIGGGLFLILTSFYKEIIDILYSNDYRLAYPLVIPLSFVILLRTASSIYGSLLTISNNQINRVKVVFISMLTSIVLNFLLIPVFGIVVAAWISVVVHLIIFFGYYYYSKKEFLGINFMTFENICILVFTLFVFILSNIVFSYNTLLSFLFLLIWGVGIYFFLKKHKKLIIIKEILKDKGVM